MRSHHHHDDYDYKRMYHDLKHDFKRKKRQVEDLEDQLRGEEQNCKKLKTENTDFWKLYNTLQQELTSAYERNSKSQNDRATLEALFDSERQDWAKQRSELSIGGQEAEKLKEALCNMQREKLAMQKKFNDLVVENKTLKDKERELEPKLREADELKRKVAEFESSLLLLQANFAKQKAKIKDATVRQEQIDGAKRWNEILKLDLDQKTKKIENWDVLLKGYKFLERKLEDAESKAKARIDECDNLRRSGETTSAHIDAVNQRISDCSLKVAELKQDVNELRALFQHDSLHLGEIIAKMKNIFDNIRSKTAPPGNGDIIELSASSILITSDQMFETADQTCDTSIGTLTDTSSSPQSKQTATNSFPSVSEQPNPQPGALLF